MATHSSILARRIPRTEGPGGLQTKVSQRDTTEATSYKHAQVMWTTVQQLEEASKNRLFLGLYEGKAMIKGGMSEVMPVRLAGARSHS